MQNKWLEQIVAYLFGAKVVQVKKYLQELFMIIVREKGNLYLLTVVPYQMSYLKVSFLGMNQVRLQEQVKRVE